MYSVAAKTSHKRSKKPLLFVLLFLLIAGGVAAGYKLTRGTPENLVIPNQENTTPEQNSQEEQEQTPQPSTDKSASGDEKNSDGNPLPQAPLQEPSGAFVSNHRPSLGASPKLTTVESVCNTTPGAKCYIRFTKGNLTRTLPTKTADKNGVALWTWSVKDAKLTQGVWKITAFAELNGQTKSATDAINLEVQP
jgi:hypothetical protein